MPKKTRLDQILLQLGYITESDLQEALRRQRSHGGRLGAALMYSRRLTEKQLVEALSQQFGVPGVIISSVDIADELVRLFPKRILRSRTALPFAYKPDDNALSVAVADPQQSGLLEELSFVARGKNIQLFVACELALKTALAQCLDGDNASMESKMSLQFPTELLSETEDKPTTEDKAKSLPRRERILVLTTESFSAPLVKSIIERSGAQVTVVSDLNSMEAELQAHEFSCVFLQHDVTPDPEALRSRIRKLRRQARVRWFNDCSAWLTDAAQVNHSPELFQDFSRIMDMLTVRLQGTNTPVLNVTSCSQGIAERLYIKDEEANELCLLTQLYRAAGLTDDTDRTQMTPSEYFAQLANLAESAGFSPIIVESLRACYSKISLTQLSGSFTTTELFASIITALDIALACLEEYDRITLDAFEMLRSELNSHAGVIVLPDVVDSLLLSVQSSLLEDELAEPHLEALVYYATGSQGQPSQEMQMRADGIRVVNTHSLTDLSRAFERREPDVLILHIPSIEMEAETALAEFESTEIDFHATTTLIITDADSRSELETLYRAGVNDVLSSDTSPQMLSAKVIALVERARKSREVAKSHAGEARGDLSQMNLIDLIQAMGPSRKTVRITVDNDQSQLTLYMLDGRMVYARLGEISGPEAIFEGVQWQSGAFVVSRTRVTEIPAPNIELPNESILMEGCRLMDEELKDS